MNWSLNGIERISVTCKLRKGAKKCTLQEEPGDRHMRHIRLSYKQLPVVHITNVGFVAYTMENERDAPINREMPVHPCPYDQGGDVVRNIHLAGCAAGAIRR